MPPRIENTFWKPCPRKYAATSSERTPLLQWNTMRLSFGSAMYRPGSSKSSGSAAAMRAIAAAASTVLASAADAHLKVFVVDDGRMRPLRLDDLMGRPLGEVDWVGIRAAIAGKRVLITGGGGSIGSELARRVSALAPQRLTLLDSSEFNLFKMSLDLPSAALALADVRDAASMRRWFARERPDVVFHAAALKQVPLVEAFASEGVLTNVSGLRNVIEAILWHGGEGRYSRDAFLKMTKTDRLALLQFLNSL